MKSQIEILQAEFGDDYDFVFNDTKYSFSITVTGKKVNVTSVYAELDDVLYDMGYTSTSYKTDTGLHGSTHYLEDGRVQVTYFKRGKK